MDLGIILWDIDGVLVKVSDSYRKAIIESVQHYFSGFMGLSLDHELMSYEDTQAFKLAGGFNDDWELTYGAVSCFLSRLLEQLEPPQSPPLEEGFDGMLARLKALGESAEALSLEVDLKSILEKVESQGGGLPALDNVLSGLYPSGFVRAKDFFFPGLIKRVFEELYLGDQLFFRKYHEKPRFFSGGGFISNEESLVDFETLLQLRKKYHFGIVTGRERFEAEYIVHHFGLQGMFPPETIVAREDTKEKKPSPQPLLECKKRVCSKYLIPSDSNVIYIGDSLDDLAAARNAGFYFVAIVGGLGDVDEVNRLRMELHDKICDLIVDEPRELLLYL